METQKTCKELVSKELKNRLSDLKVLWEDWKNGIEDNSEHGNIYEYGLSFDYVSPNIFKGQFKGYFRYQLSWGGPSDEFRIFTNPVYHLNKYNESSISGFKIEKIEYWYLDWFDGAKKKLTGKSLEFISEIFQSFFVESECAKTEYEKSLIEEY